MKVKKYIAKTMHEAMKQIRAELGDEAVILSSKEVESGGFLGFFTTKNIEVVAAVDPVPESKPLPKEKPLKKTVEKRNPSTTQTNESEKQLMREVEELKRLVKGIHSTSNQLEQQQYPAPFQKIENQLKAHGVSDSIRLELFKNLLRDWYNKDEENKSGLNLEAEASQFLLRELSTVPVKGLTFQKKVINIVGPTGVGKTTTIAKIAAECVLKQQKKVVFITTDTYRIAAVDQLKTYAKILNIPIEVAYSVEDFKKAKEQYQHYDVILVDSAGRNFRNKLYVEELSKVIDFNEEAETILVLALTSKYEDMKQIISQFSLIPIKQVIFTKRDETSSYGALVNVPLEYGLGVAYITNGQNVPDDMSEATIHQLVDPLFIGNQ